MDEENTSIDHANDSILASWNEIRGGQTEEVAKDEPAAVDAEAGKEVVKEDKTRGPDGKFLPKAKEVVAEESAPLPGTPATEEEIAAAAEVQKPAVESPKSLRKELADKHWTKLDPEIQAAWQERDQSYERGIQRYRERADVADRFDAAFAPYQQTLQQVGATPEQAISTLLSLDHILRHGQPQEKAALVHQLVRQFNVPLEDVSQVGPLQQQLLAQRQQLHQHEAQQLQAKQQQAQRELDTLTSEVIKFSEGKEHFGSVQNEMYAVLPSINQQFPQATAQEKLQKAYDIAVQANPSVRQALALKEQEKAQAEARKKAIEAKKASSVNRTPRGVIATAPSVGSMEDTIRAKAKELGFA